MSAHRVPFVFPYPATLASTRRLSAIRAWATGQIHNHARRTGSRVVGEPYGWRYDDTEDGRPAVSCMAVLAPLPTALSMRDELRDRPAKAQRDGHCLTCREVARLRACDWTDHDIAARLEISLRALTRHTDNHEENTGT